MATGEKSNPLAWISENLDQLKEQGLHRRQRIVTPLPDGRCLLDGRTLLNYASNDYLNLAHDPRVIAAARGALEQCGSGASASALVTGHTHWHAELEKKLAAFEGQPAALLFPSGYAANVGTVSTLVQSGDIVFSDRLNHASLLEGCRLSGATLKVFHRSDLTKLQRELSKGAGARRRLIVTDSLFSMEGDAAPLAELCELAQRYNAMLMIDEAHATGIFGRHGRGIAELLGVEDRVTIRAGTLSKAIASLGGFVTGSEQLIQWLWNHARTQMFSTALPPSACAAAIAALEIIQTEPGRREDLLHRAATFRAHLRSADIPTVATAIGPIVPVILNSPHLALQAAAQLEDHGYLVAAIRPPTVPQDTSRLRITLSCAHTQDEDARLLDVLEQVLSTPQ